MTAAMKPGWFRPSPGMQRISDWKARQMDEAPFRPVEVVPYEPMGGLCACGDPVVARGQCRACIQRARIKAMDCRCRCGEPLDIDGHPTACAGCDVGSEIEKGN